MTSLEDFTNLFSAALNTEKDAQWKAGEIVNLAISQVEAQNGKPPKGVQAKIFNAFAYAARCTAARVRQLGLVEAAFEPGLRDQLASWSHYRACGQTARRLGIMPADVVAKAALGDWGLKEIVNFGRERGQKVDFHGKCLDCGARVSVVLADAPDHKGHPLCCPVCHGEEFGGKLGRLG